VTIGQGTYNDELFKIQRGYIWLDRNGRSIINICQIIKTRFNDIQRQSKREKMKQRISLVSYWSTKQEWER
jgi:hypothetical protein